MDVEGAVDSLLGTLASVIVDEARLLGSLRGDVQFIKDEMESMNGFLLHVNEASEEGGDHQVRAWKKQVRDVAVDSERWVQRYRRWADEVPRGEGLRGFVRRIPHSVSTVCERHEIASKIQELKARAHEVGERRHRYGVEVPAGTKQRPVLLDPQLAGGGDETEEHRYALRRHLEDPKEHSITEEDARDLIAWLEANDTAAAAELKAIQVVGLGGPGKARLASKVFNVVGGFARRSWVTVPPGKEMSEQRIVEKLASDLDGWYGPPPDARTPIDKVSRHLQAGRFLIVFDGVTNPKPWEILPGAGGAFPAGSAVIVITQDPSSIQSSYHATLDTASRPNSIVLNLARATSLVDDDDGDDKIRVLSNIMARLSPDKFCSKMILRLLYVNPNMTPEQLQCLCDGLHVRGDWNNTRQVLLFCYNDLPSDYRSCLQYLCIYPPGWRMRRTCLVRRWLAEGLIARRPGLSASDAAERCFAALLDRGLLVPRRFSAAGKVTLVVLPEQVISFIVATARADSFADQNMLPDLAPYLSIGNGIQLQQVPKERRRHHYSCSSILQSIICSCSCNCKHGVPAATEPASAGPPRSIMQLLDSLPALERQGLLKVLDLEFCKGFRMQHMNRMKNICQISELRYLNLRGTDITELPEEIGKLENLETLDIRQTKIAVLPGKTVLLRRLKHLLSGHTEGGNGLGSKESFCAVHMPHGIIGHLTELQILSHVEISCNDSNRKSSNGLDELIGDLERLRKLRKLGVVLRGGTGHLHNLLRAIGKLDRCLRSLSIHFIPPADDDDDDYSTVGTDMIKIPKSVGSIKISGFRFGLPSWALKPNNQLVKVTLQETSLNNSNLRMLAKLASLCCLRLRFINVRKGDSDASYQLVLKEDDFENLKVLVLEHTNITALIFQQGTAARKLEKMVWSYSKVDALSGIDRLARLGEIGLVGSAVSNGVAQAIAAHPNPIHVYFDLAHSDANEQG